MSASTIPFWGQAWDLEIEYVAADGSVQVLQVSTDAWEPEALRITFEVIQSTIPSQWWYADISIYNLNIPTIDSVVSGAVQVRLSAGFQTGPAQSALIWQSSILQVLLTQEDVVDTKLTLHCVANPAGMAEPLAFSIGQYADQAAMLTRAAGTIGLPPMENSQAVNTLSPYAQQVLKAKQYPRGNTMFGLFGSQLETVANDQNLQTFRNAGAAFMTEVSDGQSTLLPDFIYAEPSPPNTTAVDLPPGTVQSIIGTPIQTPNGIVFTVLLDPRLQVKLPVQVVYIAGTPLITQAPISNDASSFITPIDQLLFFVGQVRHVGDSRGNDWYTEVTGYNPTYAAQLLQGNFSTSTGG